MDDLGVDAPSERVARDWPNKQIARDFDVLQATVKTLLESLFRLSGRRPAGPRHVVAHWPAPAPRAPVRND